MSKDKTQLERFKEAARELEADDDEARFDEKLGKLVKSGTKPKLTEDSSSESIGTDGDDG
ncbi:hypothetical protein [Tateyamaria sp. SN3-11]|uniref:hypothetical protein n=1 Tax=Tateyamaria sp. SN3-11 TaxID=3092147 RepID=UPI0039E8EB91